MPRKAENPTVYSTDHGQMCPTCSQPVADCVCHRAPASKKQPGRDGIVRVGRETQGRKGKGVTVIHGLALADADLQQLARQLKQRCGSGGTVKEGVIEIQGEHRDVCIAELTRRGYTVKRSGG